MAIWVHWNVVVDFDDFLSFQNPLVRNPVPCCGVYDDHQGFFDYFLIHALAYIPQEGHIIAFIIIGEIDFLLRKGQGYDTAQSHGGADGVSIGSEVPSYNYGIIFLDFLKYLYSYVLHIFSSTRASRSFSISMASSFVFSVAPLALRCPPPPYFTAILFIS